MVAVTPGAAGTSRRLAPEIINPSQKGNAAPMMESKAADVFAFGMFAVEVFTGKIPFEEQKYGAVALRISRGGEPEVPRSAQGVGLTSEMWGLLENCWQQNPSKRPTMEEVAERWRGLVESNSDDKSIVTECVQIALVILTSSSVSFSAFYGRFREPQPAPGPALRTSRLRAKNEAVQLRTGSEAVRSRTKSEHIRFRTNPESPERRAKPKVVRLRTRSPVPRPGGSVCQDNADSKY